MKNLVQVNLLHVCICALLETVEDNIRAPAAYLVLITSGRRILNLYLLHATRSGFLLKRKRVEEGCSTTRAY